MLIVRDIVWGLFWLGVGILLGNKLIPQAKRIKLPKGEKYINPEKKHITEISEIKTGDGKPTYWDNGISVKDPDIVPEGVPYFTVGVFDGKGFGGGKHHKIWSKRKSITTLRSKIIKKVGRYKKRKS